MGLSDGKKARNKRAADNTKPSRSARNLRAIKNEPLALPRSREHFEEQLANYLLTIEKLPNENSRSHRFSVFLHERFGLELDVVSTYFAGMEKGLKANHAGQILKGRVDNLFGNLVIEFKKDLPSTLEEATEQLKKYIGLLWSNEAPGQRAPYLGLATDGVHFYAYSPTADPAQNTFKASDITLNKIDEVDWTRLSSDDVWMWLDRYFLREEPQIPQTDTIVRDFGIDSHVFGAVSSVLNACWQSQKSKSSFDVVYDSWEKYLRIVYGESVGADELFIRHTYLATLAKLLSWIRVSDAGHTPSDAEVDEVIRGDYFKNHGIQNFIEEDFFSWIVREGAKEDGIKSVKWMLSILRKYDLRNLSEDVLKSLYQGLVDPHTRRYLGEFYTPDWLASRIVNQALKKNPLGSILDPSCGSGTFLYLAVQRKRQLLGDSQINLAHILANVQGIDIHPLAVIIAKTNYILALGDLLSQRKEPISIPIYLSDSVRLPEKEQMSVFVQVPSFKVKLDGHDVHLAEEFVKDYALYDQTVELARDYAIQHKHRSVDLNSFKQFLKVNRYPRFTDEHFTRAAFEIAQKLKFFIDCDRDSIWSYVLKNIYKPLFMKNQFDFVLGNPPWLSYRAMESGYQKSLKDLIISQYKMAGKGETIAAMEVATLFFLRASDLYLKEGGEIAFVLPRSIFSSDQHASLRSSRFKFAEHTNQTINWKEIWDFKSVKPIFKVPCCVLQAQKVKSSTAQTSVIPAFIFEGRLPGLNLSLEPAEKLLSIKQSTLSLHTLGERSFWAEGTAAASSSRSPYYEKFWEGANLVPRACWFVTIAPSKFGIDLHCPALVTEPQAIKTAKDNYRDINLKGNVECQFVYGTLTGSEVIPFGHTGLRAVVLPIVRDKHGIVLLDANDARKHGYLKLSKWLRTTEDIWNKKRGVKAQLGSLKDWINYQNKLARQDPEAKFKVVYNGSGKNLSATVIAASQDLCFRAEGQSLNLAGFIADCKLFYYETNNETEAHYLTALLNSAVINEMIKPMQSHGEHNPRDIHKKVFELPIPSFDSKNNNHKNLARLSKIASRKVAAWVDSSLVVETQGLAATRQQARELITDQLSEIETLVKQVIQSSDQ